MGSFPQGGLWEIIEKYKVKDKTNFSEPSFICDEQFYNSTPDDFLEATPRPSAKNHMGTVVKLSEKKIGSEKLVLSFDDVLDKWTLLRNSHLYLGGMCLTIAFARG